MKKRRTLRKFLLLLSSALLVASLTVGATVAYLTDSESVVNTFTVGNVQIKLDETITAYDQASNVWKSTGARTTDTTSQQYKLLPGTVVEKDPTVYVVGGSEEAYIRMLVKVNDITKLRGAFAKDQYPTYYGDDDVFLLQSAVTGWDSSKWPFEKITSDDNEVTYEFRYAATVGASDKASDESVKLDALFKTVVIPDTLDNTAIANLDGVSITVIAEAIQAAGFAAADDAWTAFEKQN